MDTGIPSSGYLVAYKLPAGEFTEYILALVLQNFIDLVAGGFFIELRQI
jgi:hypothetical protein